MRDEDEPERETGARPPENAIREEAIAGPGEAARIEILPPEAAAGHAPPVPPPAPPAILEHEPRTRRFRRLLLLLLPLSAIAGYAAWTRMETGFPPGIIAAAGRIEADPIDIATKFSGRITALLADEGEWVHAGQIVARMDTRDLEAELAREEARIGEAERNRDQVRADLDRQKALLLLAERVFRRAAALFQSGNGPKEVLDQRQAQLAVAHAELEAAQARLGRAGRAVEAAREDAALTRVNIAGNALTAPVEGRIEYRLGSPGEVMSAGGKVFTMLDTASIHMDVFLSTALAGRIRVGTEARILPGNLQSPPLPAQVSMIAGESPFFPKPVETEAGRAKLMFRVRLRPDPASLQAQAGLLRSGLPATAYLRLDPAADWPARLQPALRPLPP